MVYLGTLTLVTLRDPRYIREFKAAHCVEVFAENVTTKKKCVIPPPHFLASLICILGRSYGEERTSPRWIIPGRSDSRGPFIYLLISEPSISSRTVCPRCDLVIIDVIGNATTPFKSETKSAVLQRHGYAAQRTQARIVYCYDN